MVARVLFPVLTCGATRSHHRHRATIKALPTSAQLPSPLRNPAAQLYSSSIRSTSTFILLP